MNAGRFFVAYSDQSNRDIDNLIRAYGQLPIRLARKHMQAAMRRSIRPFAPALRRATPKKSGGLRKSVKVRVKFSNRMTRTSWGSFSGGVTGTIGFGRGGSSPTRMGNHASIVEAGTKERARKSGARTGTMPARRMVRDTLAAHRAGILASLELELGVSLERAARELAYRSN